MYSHCGGRNCVIDTDTKIALTDANADWFHSIHPYSVHAKTMSMVIPASLMRRKRLSRPFCIFHSNCANGFSIYRNVKRSLVIDSVEKTQPAEKKACVQFGVFHFWLDFGLFTGTPIQQPLKLAPFVNSEKLRIVRIPIFTLVWSNKTNHVSPIYLCVTRMYGVYQLQAIGQKSSIKQQIVRVRKRYIPAIGWPKSTAFTKCNRRSLHRRWITVIQSNVDHKLPVTIFCADLRNCCESFLSMR